MKSILITLTLTFFTFSQNTFGLGDPVNFSNGELYNSILNEKTIHFEDLNNNGNIDEIAISYESVEDEGNTGYERTDYFWNLHFRYKDENNLVSESHSTNILHLKYISDIFYSENNSSEYLMNLEFKFIDINNDSRKDLVLTFVIDGISMPVPEFYTKLKIYTQEENGAFSFSEELDIANGWPYYNFYDYIPRKIYFSDLNNDGLPDLIREVGVNPAFYQGYDPSDYYQGIIYNDGSGAFLNKDAAGLYDNILNRNWPTHFVDLNLDGYTDFVFDNSNVLYNPVTQSYEDDYTNYNIGFENILNNDYDFNGDNINDVIAEINNQDGFYYFLRNTDGSFQNGILISNDNYLNTIEINNEYTYPEFFIANDIYYGFIEFNGLEWNKKYFGEGNPRFIGFIDLNNDQEKECWLFSSKLDQAYHNQINQFQIKYHDNNNIELSCDCSFENCNQLINLEISPPVTAFDYQLLYNDSILIQSGVFESPFEYYLEESGYYSLILFDNDISFTYYFDYFEAITLSTNALNDLTYDCIYFADSLNYPVATDSCGNIYVANPTTAFPITESQNLIWQYENGLTQEQFITINNDSPPTPVMADLPALFYCESSLIEIPTAVNNCNDTLYGVSNVALPLSDLNTTEIVWTYTDQFGNQSTQSQDVNLDSPIILQEEELDQLSAYCAFEISTAPYAENICGELIEGTTPTVSFDEEGNYIIVWTFTDQQGVSVQQTQFLEILALEYELVQSGNVLEMIAEFDQIQWLDCDNGMTPIPNATSLFFEPANSGNYAAEVTKDGCTIVSDCFNFTIVNIEENASFKNSINIFPLPAKDILNIHLNESISNGSVELFNLNGQLTFEIAIHNQQAIKIDLNAEAGIYLAVIKDHEKGTSYNERIIIE